MVRLRSFLEEGIQDGLSSRTIPSTIVNQNHNRPHTFTHAERRANSWLAERVNS